MKKMKLAVYNELSSRRRRRTFAMDFIFTRSSLFVFNLLMDTFLISKSGRRRFKFVVRIILELFNARHRTFRVRNEYLLGQKEGFGTFRIFVFESINKAEYENIAYANVTNRYQYSINIYFSTRPKIYLYAANENI